MPVSKTRKTTKQAKHSQSSASEKSQHEMADLSGLKVTHDADGTCIVLLFVDREGQRVGDYAIGLEDVESFVQGCLNQRDCALSHHEKPEHVSCH